MFTCTGDCSVSKHQCALGLNLYVCEYSLKEIQRFRHLCFWIYCEERPLTFSNTVFEVEGNLTIY